MNKKNKKTVGAQVIDALQEKPQEISVEKQSREMTSDYLEHLLRCVDDGYNQYKCSFFIEVQTKNERLMPNVFRNYFTNRHTCPTPNYDQSVFRYNVEKGQLEYLWTVPSRDACLHLMDNSSKVAYEEQGLLEFVKLFADGTLFKMCKKYNNEKLDSLEIIQ